MPRKTNNENSKPSTDSLSSPLSSALTEESPAENPTDNLITPVRYFSISNAELSLPVVLKCGQTFRWNQSKFKISSQNIQDGNLRQDPEDDKKLKLETFDSDLPSELIEWCVAWTDRTIVLRQDDHRIYYVAIYQPSDVHKYQTDLKLDTTYELLKAYFVLDVSLVELYQDWSKRDPHFSRKVACGQWDGLRVCRQDGWETMISFICSANNNIPRISLMLNRLCASFGDPMPRPPQGVTLCNREKYIIEPSDSSSSMEMYSFPSPTRLTQPEILEKLKLLGFGYRANYVYKTAMKICEIGHAAQEGSCWPGFETDRSISKVKNELDDQSKPFEPENYLNFLANQTYEIAHSKLVSQFPGVGPKVADCICLFGLGFVHVVPVDVHIYKIASRDYQLDIFQSAKKKTIHSSTSELQKPSSSRKVIKTSSTKAKKSKKNDQFSPSTNSQVTTSLSKLNYLKIQNFFFDLWGPWAGWTQQILFLADLNKTPS